MTDAEIIKAYREAKFPAQQIQILADLNECEPSDIRMIVGDSTPLDLKAEKPKRKYTKKPEPKKTENIPDPDETDEMPQEASVLLQMRVKELKICAENAKKEAEDYLKRAEKLEKWLAKNTARIQ